MVVDVVSNLLLVVSANLVVVAGWGLFDFFFFFAFLLFDLY